MKIENIIINNNVAVDNTVTFTFNMIEFEGYVDLFLKINDQEFKQLSKNLEPGEVNYTTSDIPRGINTIRFKISNETDEYITEPIELIIKKNATIENFSCIYSDSTGKYILEFEILGDDLFKYNVYTELDNNEYQETMTNQLIGKKTIEGIDEMGSHTYRIKVSDGYDEYESEEFTFEITNQKPILSNVLVTNVENSGTANIYYAVKDIENSTLTHKLKINNTEEVINPTRVDSFYTYVLTNLNVGTYTCTISISDGIDTVKTNEFTIQIFGETTDKKEILRRAKIRYDEAYIGLRDIVLSVVSDGVFNYDIENAIIQKAKENYNVNYSNFNKAIQQSIDTIGTNKVNVNKEELKKEINDVDNALNTLENTMETTFKDGILSDSEKALLRENLNIIAKEKADIDRDYETLYANEDLLDPAKSKLSEKYNAFVEKQNELALVMTEIIEKETIIDNDDKASIDTAFENWRIALGDYRNASLEAIDSIAKKKVDDKTEILSKQWSDLTVDIDGIKLSVGSLEEKVSIMDDNIDHAIKTVQVMYYLSTSTTNLVGGEWKDVAPTWEQGKYMWSKTVTTLTDGTQTESSPVCIAGAKGQDGTSVRILGSYTTEEELNNAHPSGNENGDGYVVGYDLYVWNGTRFINVGQIKGQDGVDAIQYYTWIRYSSESDGSNMTSEPNEETVYIGIAVNQTSSTPSENKNDYVWSKFIGEDGINGTDAVPSYTWIKYADDANGNGISDNPTDKIYIGFAYNKETKEETNNPSDYNWSLIKGSDGINAIQYYTWIRYSDNEDGEGLYDIPNEDTKYIGIAINKTSQTESTNKDDYIWSKFKGEDGVKGKDGKNLYTWIKYANDSLGNGISNDPLNKKYIGLAYNKETEVESDIPSDYKWSLIKGIDGVDGIDGIDGVDGTTFYTWIRYADYPDGTNMYNIPTNNTKYIGIAINKVTHIESDEKSDYTWSRFRGDDGIDGVDGMDGIDGVGISNITELYYLSSSKTEQIDGSWVTECPTWVKGKYLWTRTKIEYTDGSIEYTDPICDSSWEVTNGLSDEVKVVTEKISEIEVENDRITSTVSSLQSTVDSNTTTINNQSSQITQLNNSITSTVSTVNSLNTKVNNHTTQITQLDDSITSTVTSVNSLNSKVSTNSTKITQLSNQISSTVSEDDVRSIIEQSPDEIRFGFNDISNYVTISSSGLTVTKGAISCDMITNYSSNAIIRLFKGNGLDMAIDATSAYETGVGDAIRLKRDSNNYLFVGNGSIQFYCSGSGNNESAVASIRGASSNAYCALNTKGGTFELNNGVGYINSVQISMNGHTHSGYASSSHTHSGYASSSHSHSGYASTSHEHDYICYSGSYGVESYYGYNYFRCGSSTLRHDNGASGYGYNWKFAPTNGGIDLGNDSDWQRWRYVYCTSVNQSSDIRYKENIQYLDNNVSVFSLSDEEPTPFLDFIKNDFKPATFDYKIAREDEGHVLNDSQLGFVANDIMNTDVGKMFIYNTGTKTETNLSFSPTGYTTVVARALQEEIRIRDKQISNLEQRIEELENKLNNSNK